MEQEQRDLEVIRAMYRENHGTAEERIEVIKERALEAVHIAQVRKARKEAS
jgi:hypothetical protein